MKIMQEKIDKLNREKYIEFIKNLIINSEQYKRNIDSNSYVIALDSPWGTGKSYFIDLFLQSIRDETSICAVNYNAWKNDYRDNAFEPLIYDILTSDCLQFSVNNNAEKENIKKLANNIVKICAAFGKSYIEKIVEDKTGVKFNAPNNIHSAEDFKNFMLREIPNLTELNSERESFDDFKKYLRNAIQYLKDYKKKLVIIIDELDRCKPTFAIQTLEIVKHLFDIENIVFIFAVLKTKTDYTQNKKINFCLNIYDKQNQLLNKSKRHNSDKNKSKILEDVKSSENILRIEYKAYYESIRLLCKKFKISNTLIVSVEAVLTVGTFAADFTTFTSLLFNTTNAFSTFKFFITSTNFFVLISSNFNSSTTINLFSWTLDVKADFKAALFSFLFILNE